MQDESKPHLIDPFFPPYDSGPDRRLECLKIAQAQLVANDAAGLVKYAEELYAFVQGKE